MTAFCNMVPCLVEVDRCFIGAYCLHHPHCLDGGRGMHLWSVTSARLHGTISQKAVTFILTITGSWNVNKCKHIHRKVFIYKMLIPVLHIAVLTQQITKIWDFRFSQQRVWSLESSGMYCHVVTLKLTDVSEVHTASIIRAMNDVYIYHSSPWWRQYAPLKSWSTSTWLHGTASQKIINFKFQKFSKFYPYASTWYGAHLIKVCYLHSKIPDVLWFSSHAHMLTSITCPLL
jgi:hypothetical protein